MTKNKLSPQEQNEILQILKKRFLENPNRHKNIKWENIDAKLKLPSNIQKLISLYQMEITGGEPDVIDYDKKTNKYTFCDCSKESPLERRNLCYDNEALEARKKFKPKDSAINMAIKTGVELLNEEQYRKLQNLGEFDTKTSSWLQTPDSIRNLGGAIFGDRRYNHVFIYHNGADSYYASRGFRGMIRI